MQKGKSVPSGSNANTHYQPLNLSDRFSGFPDPPVPVVYVARVSLSLERLNTKWCVAAFMFILSVAINSTGCMNPRPFVSLAHVDFPRDGKLADAGGAAEFSEIFVGRETSSERCEWIFRSNNITQQRAVLPLHYIHYRRHCQVGCCWQTCGRRWGEWQHEEGRKLKGVQEWRRSTLYK